MATEKQIGFIKGLFKQTGHPQKDILKERKIQDLTTKEASLVIERLLALQPKKPKKTKVKKTSGNLSKVRIHFDGGSSPNPGHGASAAVLIVNDKVVDSKSEYLGEQVTNNFAELMGMKLAFDIYKKHIKEYKDIPIYSDSTYAVGCVNGDYKKIKKNKEIIFDLKFEFSTMKTNLIHVLRENNAIADELVNKTRDEYLNEI